MDRNFIRHGPVGHKPLCGESYETSTPNLESMTPQNQWHHPEQQPSTLHHHQSQNPQQLLHSHASHHQSPHLYPFYHCRVFPQEPDTHISCSLNFYSKSNVPCSSPEASTWSALNHCPCHSRGCCDQTPPASLEHIDFYPNQTVMTKNLPQ
ncbi:hypothetical protein Dimus_037925 [Dionaea muscipula]